MTKPKPTRPTTPDRIVAHLATQQWPIPARDIADATGIKIRTVNMTLAKLDTEGRAQKVPGGLTPSGNFYLIAWQVAA